MDESGMTILAQRFLFSVHGGVWGSAVEGDAVLRFGLDGVMAG